MVDDFKEGRVLETLNSSDYEFGLIYLIAPPFEDIVKSLSTAYNKHIVFKPC